MILFDFIDLPQNLSNLDEFGHKELLIRIFLRIPKGVCNSATLRTQDFAQGADGGQAGRTRLR